MARFGRSSKAILATVDPRLQRVFEAVVIHFDCKPLQGKRTVEEQQDLYAIGRTKSLGQSTVTNCDGIKRKSRHQSGKAIDILPYPINWSDTKRMRYFAGVVMTEARHMGIGLRWGGDWDGDTELSDNSFNDLPHFELI